MSNPFRPLKNILDTLKKGKKNVPEPQTPMNQHVMDVPSTIIQTPRNDDELSNESDPDSEVGLDHESTPDDGLFAEDTSNPKRDNGSVHPNSRPYKEDLKAFRKEYKEETWSRQVLKVVNPNQGSDVDASNFTELSENLRLAVMNKACADVIIRLGSNLQLVPVHKVILAAGSPYFYQLFTQKQDLVDKSSGLIKLDFAHLMAEAFLKVLEYLYTGVARLKQDDVLEVLALAEQFEIPTLKEMCSQYIQESVDVENSCMLLELAREYNSKSLETFCLLFIDKNIQRVLTTKGFEDLSEATLLQVISRDELETAVEEEIDIFLAVYRWTKNRYSSYSTVKNATPDQINREMQQIAKDVITHVRFPLMTSDQMSSIVEPKNFVSNDLTFEVYKYHVVGNGKNTQELPQGERFTVRGKKKQNKSFITQRHNILSPIKRDSLGKRQGSFVLEKSSSPHSSPLKKVHFEPVPFYQETPVKRFDDYGHVEVVNTPGTIYYNV
jgi:hypothetical protein